MSAGFIKPINPEIEFGTPINEINVEELTGLNKSTLLNISGLVGLGGNPNSIAGEIKGGYPSVVFIAEYAGVHVTLVANIQSRIIHFASIKIKSKNLRRKRRGSRLLESQVMFASIFNFSELRGRAARPDGFISWAKLGYVMYLIKDTDRFHNLMETKRKKNKKLPVPEFIMAKTLNELVTFPDGTKSWKRQGWAWSAKFNLSANSTSRTILKNYLSRMN